MGVMQGLFAMLFGGERNLIAETAGIFRENPEASAEREALRTAAALGQFAAEFALPRQGPFDRFVDGVNRLPRPALAFGTLGLFVSAMVDPEWFAARMVGLAQVPDPLWWLLGAIVSFYFGARYQAKGHAFHRSLWLATGGSALMKERNAALTDWLREGENTNRREGVSP